MKKVKVHPVRSLKHIFAASGLVKVDDKFYVIADDDLSLGIVHQDKEIKLTKLVPGILSKDHKERKKVKPDWEALTLISKSHDLIELLAVPSGSSPARQTGVLIEIKGEQIFSKPIDFSRLYNSLLKLFPNLNIEGACFTKQDFQLFQRGNGPDSKNAIIKLELGGVLNDIRNTQSISQDRILYMTEYDLGKIKGVPFSFTDACFVNENEIWFLAAAESGDSTYHDGEFVGSTIGIIDSNGTIKHSFPLDIDFKPEGLSVEVYDTNERVVHIVTDADSSETNSLLYKADLSLHAIGS